MSVEALFRPIALGSVQLSNSIAMAPMTRSRAIGNTPNELMAEYYAQRATAGLIITEGTAPSANGLGYARTPGIFTDEQEAGWKKITDAVHARGGKIAVQLMHVGRVAHPANQPEGARIVSSSPVPPAGTQMWVDSAMAQLDIPVPEEMSHEDIRQAVEEFAQAATRSIRAGFDAVELHGANGYLIEQFINATANLRTDEYGGSIENRLRFALEVVDAVGAAIGFHKLGIRISPYGANAGMGIYDTMDDTYIALAKELKARGIAFLHIADHSAMGAPEVPTSLIKALKEAFGGPLLMAHGFDTASAEEALRSGLIDVAVFGRPFISNPDLVERIRTGADFAQPDFGTFYTPGAEGYTTYPALEAAASL